MTILDLSCNEICNEAIQYLTNALEMNTMREIINCRIFLYVIQYIYTLTTLILQGNAIGDQEAQYLANLLQNNSVRYALYSVISYLT